MTALRFVVIPRNRAGLRPGQLVGLEELLALLRERGHQELADEIEETARNGEVVEEYETTLRPI